MDFRLPPFKKLEMRRYNNILEYLSYYRQKIKKYLAKMSENYLLYCFYSFLEIFFV